VQRVGIQLSRRPRLKRICEASSACHGAMLPCCHHGASVDAFSEALRANLDTEIRFQLRPGDLQICLAFAAPNAHLSWTERDI
jgi:hypothetical protein